MSDMDILRERARETRIKYQNNLITLEQAKEELSEFIELFNIMAIEKAKKYNVRPQKLSLMKFLNFKQG